MTSAACRPSSTGLLGADAAAAMPGACCSTADVAATSISDDAEPLFTTSTTVNERPSATTASGAANQDFCISAPANERLSLLLTVEQPRLGAAYRPRKPKAFSKLSRLNRRS